MARTILGHAATRVPLFKKCIICHEMKPAADFSQYAYVTGQSKLSRRLDSRCHICAATVKRERQAKNRERYNAAQREYRAAHPEVVRGHLERRSADLKPFVSEKTCSHCQQTKPRSAFHRSRTAPDGLRYECKACQYDAQKIYVRLKPEKVRRWQFAARLRHKYGITVDQYEAMLASQGGKCACCASVMEPPFVDHCHRTGRVRALLCQSCNLSLGALRESLDRVAALSRYIQEYVLFRDS